jgi:peptidoglycan/xylan/chitin deacetylase (PgdA/CDA1 family)
MIIVVWLAMVLPVGCGGGSHAERPQNAHRPVGSMARLIAPARPAAREIRVPILTYHRVHLYATELTKSIPDLTVEPSDFAREMAALRGDGYRTITDEQLFDALFFGAALPQKPLLVTVDDGYVDDLKQILPVLLREHMVATFFVITRRVHEPGFLSERQIRRLAAAGMDIGAHTRTHRDLTTLAPSVADQEIAGSRADLSRVLGHPVYFFAYPFGRYGAAIERDVLASGFSMAVTTNAGAIESSRQPLLMPRIHVGRSSTPASIIACIRAPTRGPCGD